MESIYLFFIRNDIWIYILCAFGLLWYGYDFIRAQRTLRGAMFGLERESARRSRSTALLFVALLGSLAGIVFYVNSQIAPTLPPSLLRPPTPMPDPQAMPATAAPETPSAVGPTATSPLAPTVTVLTATVSVTSPEAPAPSGETPVAPVATLEILGCAPNALITDPRTNATVLGTLNVFGSANIADFGYYELEISGPQTNGAWASLLGRRITQPVSDGFLGGNVDLSEWQSGDYDVRLTIANRDGQLTNRCTVPILLEAN